MKGKLKKRLAGILVVGLFFTSNTSLITMADINAREINMEIENDESLDMNVSDTLEEDEVQITEDETMSDNYSENGDVDIENSNLFDDGSFLGNLTDEDVNEVGRVNGTNNFNTNYSLTGNGAEDIVRVALAQNGRTGGQLGYSAEEWCADFVMDCAIKAGQTDAIPNIAANANCNNLKNSILSHGGVSSINAPARGDICFWPNGTHVGIVVNVSGNTIYTIEGNTENSNNSLSKVNQHTLNKSVFSNIVRPKYQNSVSDDNPLGSLDSAVGQENSIYVSGWAYDPSNPSASIQVHVYVDNPGDPAAGSEGHVIYANKERGDVNTAFGISGQHGYQETIKTAKTGRHQLYIYAINIGNGRDTLLGTPIVDITNDNPKTNLDFASGGDRRVTVKGWAFDPNTPNESIQIHVYVGGPAGSEADSYGITTDVYREDVNKIYGISGNHGFEATIKVAKIGRQTLYVYAINKGAGSNILLGTQEVNITNDNPITALDFAKGGNESITVRGWAFDPNTPDESVTIHIYIGGPAGSGAEFHKITADDYREDVNKTYGISGKHGFHSTINVSASGKQTIYLYAINKGPGYNPLIGSPTVQIHGVADHKWDSGKITKVATCTETGIKTYTCTICKKTKTSVIAKTAHTIVKDAAVVATCEKPGWTEGSHCSMCHEITKVQTEIPAKGHSWSSWVKIKDATVSAPEQQKRSCTVCKLAQTRLYGTKLTVTPTPKPSTDRLPDKKPASSKPGVVKTTAIKGVPGKITMKKGSRKIIKAKIVPSKSTEKITYTSANKKIVTVTGKGMIKAKKRGKTKIIVKSGKKKKIINITVK